LHREIHHDDKGFTENIAVNSAGPGERRAGIEMTRLFMIVAVMMSLRGNRVILNVRNDEKCKECI